MTEHLDDTSGPLFPVVTFKRVFDTVPVQEVLGLPELLSALRRFECRDDTQANVEREIARIGRARALVDAGATADGPVGLHLTRTRAEALSAGSDGIAAVAKEVARLEEEARRDAKKDLRLWSPTLYRRNAKRGSEGVAALSCVVLDYDVGEPEDAISTWEGWFHLLHTTWSHRAARPRFRVVIPLARLVAAADWPAVWRWAAAQTGDAVDPALKGAGATYALPAVASADAPCFVRVNAGSFLDPEAEGIPLRDVDPTELHGALRPHGPADGSPSAMRRLDSRHPFVDEALGRRP